MPTPDSMDPTFTPKPITKGKLLVLALFLVPFMVLGLFLAFGKGEWSGLLFVVIPVLILVLVIWPKNQSRMWNLMRRTFGVQGKQVEAPKNPGPDGLEWDALAGGGANFQTRRLCIGKDGMARIIPSRGMWLFASAFALPGLGVMMGGVVGEMSNGSVPSWVVRAGMIAFGGIFLAAGVGMICLAKRAPVFDIQSQCCRGLKPGRTYFGEVPQDVPFSQIAGIQMLSYLQSDSDSSYTCYQINLISKDLSRWKVMTHGNLKSLESDAQTLSQLLRVPLWKRV